MKIPINRSRLNNNAQKWPLIYNANHISIQNLISGLNMAFVTQTNVLYLWAIKCTNVTID